MSWISTSLARSGHCLGLCCDRNLDQSADWGRHCRLRRGQLHLYVCLFRRELSSGDHWSCGSTRASFGVGAYDEDLK